MHANTPSAHDAKIVGLVAYYPYCYDKVEFSTPTLVLIGDKDDWTPAKLCEAVKGKPNLEMVVFPGAPTPSTCLSRSMTKRRRRRRRRTPTP
jgi:dienelactone hydrolase